MLLVREVGETRWSDACGPCLVAESIEQLARAGMSFALKVASPFGRRQHRSQSLLGIHFQRGEPEHGVGCHVDRWQVLVGGSRSDLSLAHPEKTFLVTEVNFDLPAPQVVLEQGLDIPMHVGADQIRGLAVEHFGVLAQAVAERGNAHELELALGPAFSPEQVLDDFNFEAVDLAAGERVDFDPFIGGVFANVFGRWHVVAVEAASSGPSALAW